MAITATLSIAAISSSLTKEVSEVTLPATSLAERVDTLVKMIQDDISTVGGTVEFRMRQRNVTKSKPPVDVKDLFESYPNLRYVNLDMLRAAADDLGVDITPLGGRRKEIYAALCAARRERGLSAPVAPATKNSQIAPGVDIRLIPTEIFRILLQRAGIDSEPFGTKKTDMILALATKYNKTSKDIVEAAQTVNARNKEKAAAASQANVAVAETSLGSAPVAPVSEPVVEAAAETPAPVNAAPATPTVEPISLDADTDMTASSDDASDTKIADEASSVAISVDVPTDNPFLQGSRPTQHIEQQVSSASMDLDDLLS